MEMIDPMRVGECLTLAVVLIGFVVGAKWWADRVLGTRGKKADGRSVEGHDLVNGGFSEVAEELRAVEHEAEVDVQPYDGQCIEGIVNEVDEVLLGRMTRERLKEITQE